MNIYTLNVGQGQFVIVTGKREGFIVDTHIPANNDNNEIFVKQALANALSGINLRGLIITGFDTDHFNKKGLSIIFSRYNPDWIMYPKYFHETDNAKECFQIINSANVDKYSILLSDNNSRFYYKNMSDEFYFEVFSPHRADMGSSNNCSLVVKVHERSTGATYLISGDTENERWETIIDVFGNELLSRVYAGAHHGSKGAVTTSLMTHIRPDTVLVSAGVGNQFGHPNPEAMRVYRNSANKVYCTNDNGGQSLHTVDEGHNINTYLYNAR